MLNLLLICLSVPFRSNKIEMCKYRTEMNTTIFTDDLIICAEMQKNQQNILPLISNYGKYAQNKVYM
jgi:hypothetical protein